jgi:hypothetical protein
MAFNMKMPLFGGLGHETCKLAQTNVLSNKCLRKGRSLARFNQPRDAPLITANTGARLKAVAEQATNSSKPDQRGLNIEVDNVADDASTMISITGLNKPGLLAELTQTIQKLQLEVVKVNSLSNAPKFSKIPQGCLSTVSLFIGIAPFDAHEAS